MLYIWEVSNKLDLNQTTCVLHNEIYCSIDWRLQKYPSVNLDQWSKSTNAIFSNNPCHFLSPPPLSLSLPKPLSLSVSLSSLYALFLIMFYLFPFLLNTQMIWCLIIIHRNKLTWTTTLFHLELTHNINYRIVFVAALPQLNFKITLMGLCSQGATALSIVTFSITTLSTMTFCVTINKLRHSAQRHSAYWQSVVMLRTILLIVTYKPFTLSVVMLNVVMLSVVAR